MRAMRIPVLLLCLALATLTACEDMGMTLDCDWVDNTLVCTDQN